MRRPSNGDTLDTSFRDITHSCIPTFRTVTRIGGQVFVTSISCVPCVPAWCQVPDGLVKFDMVQVDGVSDGSHWIRNSSVCGGPMKKTYELKEVYHADATPARFHSIFIDRAPPTYYMTR